MFSIACSIASQMKHIVSLQTGHELMITPRWNDFSIILWYSNGKRRSELFITRPKSHWLWNNLNRNSDGRRQTRMIYFTRHASARIINRSSLSRLLGRACAMHEPVSANYWATPMQRNESLPKMATRLKFHLKSISNFDEKKWRWNS